RDRSARTVSTHRLWKALEVLERDHSAPERPEVVWPGLESLEYLIAAPIPQLPPSPYLRAAGSVPSFGIVVSLCFRSLERDPSSSSRSSIRNSLSRTSQFLLCRRGVSEDLAGWSLRRRSMCGPRTLPGRRLLSS